MSKSIILSVLIAYLSFLDHVPRDVPFIDKIQRDTCIGQYLNGYQEGLWKCWYDGKVYEDIFHKGKYQGISKVYYDTLEENLFLIESYVNGFRHGTSVSYFRNGMPQIVTSYDRGRYYQQTEYDSLGKLLSAGNFVLDSIDTGIMTFDSETLEISEHRSNITLEEVKNGTWYHYDPNRKIVKEYYYEKGILIDSLLKKY